MEADRFSRSGRGGQRITPAQAIACGVVVAAVGWSLWLLRDRPVREEVELLPGTALPSSELAIIEAAFDRAQLADHRTEDGRVWVPRARQSAYMRALVDAEALPREFGSSLRRALERNSPWQSRAAQEELLRVALQEELAHVICSMPGIERAAVLYDVEERVAFDGSFGRPPVRTASVNVRTQPDTELEPARVQAIRVLVAASIAGLAADRVAVTDLRSGRVHAGPLAEPAPAAAEEAALAAIDPALMRRVVVERHLAAKVRHSLALVKGAVVDVTVGWQAAPPTDAEPSTPEPTLPGRQQRVADANTPAEIPPATVAAARATAERSPSGAVGPEASAGEPRSICVSVAVPETWFQAAIRAGLDREPTTSPAAIESREEQRIRDHVLRALPPAAAGDTRQVVVTSFPVVVGRQAPPGAAESGPRRGAALPPRSVADGPAAVGDLFGAAVRAMAAGRPSEAPREIWILIIIACGATLAVVIGRGGVRASGTHPPRRRSEQRIDWSAVTPEGVADRPSPDHTAARTAA